MGADAVSVGCILGGDNQEQQIAMLGRISEEAHRNGMPSSAISIPAATISPGTTSAAWRT